uniref:ATP-dependent RNA helicase n=1 Tax=Romanomermis culicivorax TaxID=13658 RepID=A0A915K227_ROMCU
MGVKDPFDRNLDDRLVKILRENGIDEMFPIQRLVVPEILRHSLGLLPFPPRDICVSAPTGSGKTLCYVLPLVQILRQQHLQRVRALILVPVVSLAQQVAQVFQIYTRDSDLKVVLATGKRNFKTECEELYDKVSTFDEDGRIKEIKLATADIVIATPGRLIDHLRRDDRAFCLKYLRYLILDEADRLMNDFRTDWLGEIENAVYETSLLKASPNRTKLTVGNMEQLSAAGVFPLQKILLSATLSHNPELLKQLNLFLPKYFSIGGIVEPAKMSSTENLGIPDELVESYVKVPLKYKPLATYKIIRDNEFAKVLCFVDKIQSSRKLACVLEKLGIQNVNEFDSTVNKFRMNRILTRFGKAKSGVLICTDVMARGMDFAKTDCVINYDWPKALKTYVHRIGRTARAGGKGSAFTILENSEVDDFKSLLSERLEKLREVEMDSSTFEPYQEKYKEALLEVRRKLETEHRKKQMKLKLKVRPGRYKIKS